MALKDKGAGSPLEVRARDTAELAGVQGTMPRGRASQAASPAGNTASISGRPASDPTPSLSGLGQAALSGQGGTPPPAAPLFPDADGGAAAHWQPLLRFGGTGGAYFGLLLKTFLLSLLTLGIYSFWGKTEQRRYLWGHTLMLGEPLEYTGTGKELFLSFLIVVPLFLVISLLFGLAATSLGPFGPLLIYFPLLFIWQFASYRALRFRLTRTRWRGIRGNMGGSALEYGLKSTGYILLTAFSLGLLYPWASGKIATLMLNNVWFGNRRLAFSGSAKSLYKVFLLSFLACAGIYAIIASIVFYRISSTQQYTMAIPHNLYTSFLPLLLMLVMLLCLVAFTSFYRAAFFRWLFEHAAFGQVRTRSTLSGGRLLTTTLINILQVVLTVGLGTAWSVIRMARIKLNSVDFRGDPQFGELLQDTKSAPKTGEGMLDALDVDIAF